MKKVYIVVAGYQFDGLRIISVHFSKELAQKVAAKTMKKKKTAYDFSHAIEFKVDP